MTIRMMKPLAAAFVVAFIAGPALGGEWATKVEAQAMVKKAVAEVVPDSGTVWRLG
jgi:hypothetical protein